MQFPVYVKLGLSGSRRQLGTIALTPSRMRSDATYFGSQHILSMGAHFRDYVVRPWMPALPTPQNAPVNHPYGHCSSKIRAGGVVGNIGETAAAAVATDLLKLSTFDIAHTRPNKPFSKRKAPDYLMRIPQASKLFGIVWPTAVTASPTWWPVESKARAGAAQAEQVVAAALLQLSAYWHTIHATAPQDVGYGIVVVMKYDAPVSIVTHVFVPRQQSALLKHLASVAYSDYVDRTSVDAQTRNCLHG